MRGRAAWPTGGYARGGFDELAAVLADLAVGEAVRSPAAPAQSLAGLVQVGAHAHLVQLVGRGDAREARAHDHHPGVARRSPLMRRRRRTRAVGGQHRSGAERPAGGDQLPSRKPCDGLLELHRRFTRLLPRTAWECSLPPARSPTGGPHAAVAIPRHLLLCSHYPSPSDALNIHSSLARRHSLHLDGLVRIVVPGQRSGARQCGINHQRTRGCESLSADRCRGRRGGQTAHLGDIRKHQRAGRRAPVPDLGVGRAPGGAHPRGHRFLFDRAGPLGRSSAAVGRDRHAPSRVRLPPGRGRGAALLAVFHHPGGVVGDPGRPVRNHRQRLLRGRGRPGRFRASGYRRSGGGRGRRDSTVDVLLLENHGCVCVAATLDEAINRAEAVEVLCRMLVAEAQGFPLRRLALDEVARLRGQGYG